MGASISLQPLSTVVGPIFSLAASHLVCSTPKADVRRPVIHDPEETSATNAHCDAATPRRRMHRELISCAPLVWGSLYEATGFSHFARWRSGIAARRACAAKRAGAAHWHRHRHLD